MQFRHLYLDFWQYFYALKLSCVDVQFNFRMYVFPYNDITKFMSIRLVVARGPVHREQVSNQVMLSNVGLGE